MPRLFRRQDEEWEAEFESTRGNMLRFSHRFLGVWGLLMFYALWNLVRGITAGLPLWASLTIGTVLIGAFYWRLFGLWRTIGRAVEAAAREADEREAARRVEAEARRLEVMKEIAEFGDQHRAVVDELRQIAKETSDADNQEPRSDDPDPREDPASAESGLHHETGDGDRDAPPSGDLEP